MSRSRAYRAYLTSPRWRMKRLQVFWRRGRECERCGGRKLLDVHHKTYERFGDERLDDLEVLCRDCHRNHHGDPRPYGEPLGDCRRLNMDDLGRAARGAS